MMFRLLALILLIFSIVLTVQAEVHDQRAIDSDPLTAKSPIAPKLEGLGDHHIDVTTNNPESQYFFDQGFRLFLGFNHSEALRSFKEAIRLDNDNAMAYWGWALVLGPNLNLPMQGAVIEQTNHAIKMAVSLKGKVSELEQAYIESLAVRYSEEKDADRKALDLAYKVSMKKLMSKYPENHDVATLYVASVMNTNPWDYWYNDGTPKGQTAEILEILDHVTTKNPKHAGAHHYKIHLVEAYRPELAEKNADQLGALMPGAGHLVHMPSHIYMRIGRYQDSYDANMLAAQTDEKYIAQCNNQGIYPLLYYPHNVHFLAWSAMYMGKSKDALEAAMKVAYPENIDATKVMQVFRAQPMFVMLRFGMWDQMLAEKKPKKEDQFMIGVWHYGRGLAHINQGNIGKAKTELENLKTIHSGEMISKKTGRPTTNKKLLIIAQAVLSSEIYGKQGDFEKALSQIDKAVRLEGGLRYAEPPSWYFPTRHILGALLMDADRAAEAEVVYWQDLAHNPENGYALYGLKLSLEAQGKDKTAKVITERFNKAWAGADTSLTSSRY